MVIYRFLYTAIVQISSWSQKLKSYLRDTLNRGRKCLLDLITVKLNLVHLISQITLMLLAWKWMILSLIKNLNFSCWDSFFLLIWLRLIHYLFCQNCLQENWALNSSMMFHSSEVNGDRISFIQDVRILCWCPVKTVIKCGESTSLALPSSLSSDFLTNKYPCELYMTGWRSARLVSLYCKNVSESIHGSNNSQMELD